MLNIKCLNSLANFTGAHAIMLHLQCVFVNVVFGFEFVCFYSFLPQLHQSFFYLTPSQR
jgi:hypothetical protein